MASTPDKLDLRRQNIPIIYARGTHYEVGFDVVRMQDFGSWKPFLTNFI